MVARAAHHFAGQLTWRGPGEFAAVFALAWIAWLDGSLPHELHGHEDAGGRSMFLPHFLARAGRAAADNYTSNFTKLLVDF